MKTTIKKLAVILVGLAAVWLACGFTNDDLEEQVTQAVVAATVPPLAQCVAAADGGFPTSAFCTMYNNNNNLLRAGANTVSAAQAPALCAKTGCIFSGKTGYDNTAPVIGTNTAGITAEMGKILYQTADAGIIKVGTVGNDFRVSTGMAGAQQFVFENAADGGVDAGNTVQLLLRGSLVQSIPPTGFYFQDAGVGADNGYGTATTFSAESPHTSFFPLEMYFVVNGSFSAGEVVTLRITAQDDNDAGYALGTTTFDAGVTASEFPLYNLWYAIAALVNDKKAAFQHKPIQRLVFDAKSDAGTTVLSVDIMVAAIQN